MRRSPEIYLVGYFLSRCTKKDPDSNRLLPPQYLKTKKWADAYRLFYPKLANGRTIAVFGHTLKNTRDLYDAHLNTGRIGWREKSIHSEHEFRDPQTLTPLAEKILFDNTEKSDDELWNLVEKYVEFDLLDIDTDYIAGFEQELEVQQGIKNHESHTEGGLKVLTSTVAERSGQLPKKAKRIHGYSCMVCGFNFEKKYGSWGSEYIVVHHMQPLYEGEIRDTNPERDLAVVCANCHAMIHRRKGVTLTLDELKNKLRRD